MASYINYVLPISPKVLAKAKTKPEGCSDIRWRMELNRRKNKNKPAPDPDKVLTPIYIWPNLKGLKG